MHAPPAKRSWWDRLPVVLKATAALLTATGGLLVTLNQLGLIGSGRKNASNAYADRPPAVQTTTATATPGPAGGGAAPAQASLAAPITPAAPDISGHWRDATGTIYQVQQSGESFEFIGANPTTGAQSRGTGTIHGRHVEDAFQTNAPSTGRGTGELSADGRQITGTAQDTYYGTYTMTLHR